MKKFKKGQTVWVKSKVEDLMSAESDSVYIQGTDGDTIDYLKKDIRPNVTRKQLEKWFEDSFEDQITKGEVNPKILKSLLRLVLGEE